MKIPASAILSTILLSGCGGGSSSSGISTPPPPVVHAAGFTNASVSGSYGFAASGESGGLFEAGNGVVTVDGSGNITSGEETVNVGGVSCHAVLGGAYSINANGTGAATVNVTVDTASASKGCIGGPANLSIAISNNGASLILASQDPTSTVLISATRQ